MGRKSLKEQLLDFVYQFQMETGSEAIDIEEVAAWLVANGAYSRPPKSMIQRAKEDIARALKNARHQDPQGRIVRTMHPVPLQVKGEQPQIDFIWVDSRTAEPIKMRAALSFKRQMILADVKRHKDDTDSYNDNNIHNAQISLFDYNFNNDLAEAAMPIEYDEDALALELEDELESI